MIFELAQPDTTAISNFGQHESQTSDFWVTRFFENQNYAAPFLSEQQLILNELDELKNLPDNWDGDGAVPVSQHSLERTKSIVLTLVNSSQIPEVTPNPNGTISLEWESDRGFLYLEIGDTNYSLLTGDGIDRPCGFQDSGLPTNDFLIPLISKVTDFERSRDTSIMADKIVA